MTHSDPPSDAFTSGFQLMRRMRDPDFRAFLKQQGWIPGVHVVMASDDEPVVDVMARMILHDTDGYAMVAIADEQRRFGFKFLSIVAPSRPRSLLRYLLVDLLRRRIRAIHIAPNASIGMLYAAFDRCGKYVPSEWSAPVTVRKEPELV